MSTFGGGGTLHAFNHPRLLSLLFSSATFTKYQRNGHGIPRMVRYRNTHKHTTHTRLERNYYPYYNIHYSSTLHTGNHSTPYHTPHTQRGRRRKTQLVTTGGSFVTAFTGGVKT